MEISDGKVVLFDYTLKDADGEVLDDSSESGPMTFVQGAGQIVPGLEAAMAGRSAGESFEVVVQPEDGYGLIDENRIIQAPRNDIDGGEDLEVGTVLGAVDEDGDEAVLFVMAIEGDDVTLNGNHPLAGEELHFEVSIREVREATQEELLHGLDEDDGEE